MMPQSMLQSDYPELFAESDNASIAAQKTYLALHKVYLFFLVV